MYPVSNLARLGLVVDDDFGVRTFTASVLAEEGYTILSASDGEEALRIAGRLASQFAFLVTDYEMGSTNGLDVAAAVRTISPSIRILMMSGSRPKGPLPSGVIDGFLSKPFSAADLCASLREVLEHPRTAAYAAAQ